MRGEAFYLLSRWRDLNPRPLPYQGSALPLSYTGNFFCFLSGRRGSNPRPSAWKADALSTELLPQNMWVEMDSNHRSDDAADLQSAPFGHSGTCPSFLYIAGSEPMEGIEPTTLRLQITRSSQLSYIGNVLFQSPLVFGTAKIGIISYSPKTFFKLFRIPSASIPHAACCWDCEACATKLSGMPSPSRVVRPGCAASHSLTAP